MEEAEPVFSRPLRRRILALIGVKALGLLALYSLFFHEVATTPSSEDRLTLHLLGPGAKAEP